MKWMKRILIAVLVLLFFGTAFLGTTYWLAKRKPAWYKPPALSSRELEAAANRALSKMIALQNVANRSAAVDSSRQWRQSTGASTLPVDPPLTITFTQDELTAFVTQWSQLNSNRVDKYITGPQFVLEEGQIIFAGHLTDLDQLGVLRLQPRIDESGQLHLEIAGVSAGSLPVPESMVLKRLAPSEALLRKWLPAWQQSAKIAADGANKDAEKAAMTKLLLNTLHHQPSPAVVYLPIESHKTVPMKLTHVAVGAGTLTLTVIPLTEEIRKVTLQNLREPIDTATAASN